MADAKQLTWEVAMHLIEQLTKRVEELEKQGFIFEAALEANGMTSDDGRDWIGRQRAEEEYSRNGTHYWDNSIGAYERRKGN